MKKWPFALILTLVLVGCGSGAEESKPADTTEGTETEQTSGEGSGSDDTVDVDKGVFNVDVTVPKTLFEMEGGDYEEVKASAEEEGIGEVIDNGDGTITYKMSRSKHKEMMQEMEKEIETSMEDIRTSGDYASIEGLSANGDYSEFTLKVDRSAYEDSFDGFAVFGVGLLGLYYQLFDGADPDSYSVVVQVTDASSGEQFDTVEFPEVLEQMEETEDQMNTE
ncbi:hypothetical protein [Salimicrobium flavidum]|uniref:Antigen I/II N-terminal domain-containing protein n=1 Tax=Salimicrobium flavidum TaxID=570947 RepID=A0A1N7IZH0_9BACI|nr:hypothetical protein [Salimicrobium flavidum]SIS42508.1 hypothetical protein SAMN05421687_10354 [Salimicrobium flavidum]